jgi:hypothetical protein
MMISFCLAARVTAADRIRFNKSSGAVLGCRSEPNASAGSLRSALQVELRIACILPDLWHLAKPQFVDTPLMAREPRVSLQNFTLQTSPGNAALAQ